MGSRTRLGDPPPRFARGARHARGGARLAALAAAAAVALALAGRAGPVAASDFLDEVDRGRAAVLGAGSAETASAQGRARAVDVAVSERGESPAFALGAGLAALNLDLDDGATAATGGDRAAVERQARVVLAAQAALGIGNRAVCLLTGRPDPRSIEALLRFVEPDWSCGSRHEHH